METLDKKQVEYTDFRIFKADNNLEKMDNLDTLPDVPAIYAIFGRINGAPANCRFIAATVNLQRAVKNHFSEQEPLPCLKQFMQSIKIKTLNFELIESLSDAEIKNKIKEWQNRFKPDCNEEMNRVY